MGGVEKEVRPERSNGFPARREDSTGRIRQAWEGLKEKLSGVNRISQIPGSITETPVPSSEDDRTYRMICLQKMDDSRKGVNGGSPSGGVKFYVLSVK